MLTLDVVIVNMTVMFILIYMTDTTIINPISIILRLVLNTPITRLCVLKVHFSMINVCNSVVQITAFLYCFKVT